MKILPENFDFSVSENGESKEKLILSLSGYSENLSKLPIVNNGDFETQSIFSILNFVAAKSTQLCILEVVGKLIKMLTQKYRPYKILELSEGQGMLAYFLKYVAKEFNEENTVLSVSQTSSLQSDCFDFCVINSSLNFPDSDGVLDDAVKSLNSGGILVFVSIDGKVIEHRKAKEAKKTEIDVLWPQMEKRIAEMEKLTKEELCQIITDLGSLEKLAVKLFADIEDIDLKSKINMAKENALNFLYYRA